MGRGGGKKEKGKNGRWGEKGGRDGEETEVNGGKRSRVEKVISRIRKENEGK